MLLFNYNYVYRNLTKYLIIYVIKINNCVNIISVLDFYNIM